MRVPLSTVLHVFPRCPLVSPDNAFLPVHPVPNRDVLLISGSFMSNGLGLYSLLLHVVPRYGLPRAEQSRAEQEFYLFCFDSLLAKCTYYGNKMQSMIKCPFVK